MHAIPRKVDPCLLYTCIALALPSNALAQETDILEVLGSERAVVAATGYKKPVRLAPGVATVVTAEDIRAIGATTLDQVLETVPGIHMSTSRDITSIPIIRGITSELNADVLVLLNGIPYGQSLTNTFAAFDNFPVNDIQRIEVLRGPFSALYGADAFAGVINIVTKTAEDIHGTEVGALAGSFDTYEGWLLHGGRWGPFDVALGVTGRTTQGFEGTVEADAQTRLDSIFGTHASAAPGSVNMGRDILDARLDVSSGPFRARAGYFGQRLGMGAGFLEALDPQGHIDIDRFNADLSYQEKLSRPLELRALLSYYRNVNTLDSRLLPPGTLTGVPPGFPDGVRERLETTEQQWRGEVSTLYSGLQKHVVHTGLGYFHTNLGDIAEERNYRFQRGLLIPTLFAGTDRLGLDAAFPPSDRDVWYGFAQDEWFFAPDWTLTTAVRVDHYSDVGTTVNPRVSLVWETLYNLTTKLLYGRAFRAPSFLEKSSRNTPIATGNPNLDAETIDSLDLVLNTRWSQRISTNLDLFGYRIHDPIKTVALPDGSSVTFVNGGETTGYGVELEAVWRPMDNLQLNAWYAFQNAVDEDTDLAPHDQVYVEADWHLVPNWHLNASLKSILDRERAAGDSRSKIDDFTFVNLTLRRVNIGHHLDLSFSVRNLLNANAREPSRSFQTLPGDLPLAGRNLYGEVIYHF